MIDCFLGDVFGVLFFPFWSSVLQCGARLPIHYYTTTLHTTGPCSQWCQFLNCWCVWVWPCTSSICGGIICRCRRVLHAAVLWSYIGTLMRLLAAEHSSTAWLLSPVSIFLEWSRSPHIRWCGTSGFQEQCQCLFIGPAASLLLSPTYCFPFSSFILWVGILGLGFSDWYYVVC